MADSQRKTANLLEYYIDSILGADGTISVSQSYQMYFAPVTAGETYTMGDTIDVYGFFSSKPAMGSVTNDGTRHFYSGTVGGVIEIPNGTTWLGCRVRTGVNAMLNTGSTPLPYEPYGWVHSLRKLGTSTDTITTLPADLYADGQSATVGLVGNMEQSGTPTPQNPIQPSECGDRTGNLFDSWAAVGVLTSTGTIDNSSTYANYRTSDYIPVEEGSYTFSLDNTVYEQYDNTSSRYAFYDEDKVFINYDISLMRPARFEWTFTAPSNAKYVRLTGRISDDNIMLNTGSTALPYEPYGYKIPILSGGVTTPVYLGEVQSTRQIKKLVLTGEENWRLQSINNYGIANFYINFSDSPLSTHGLCSHLEEQTTTIANTTTEGFLISVPSTLYLRIDSARVDTATAFKAYLTDQYSAGTPVCVWYILATPQTAVVNEPIRKIGNYADSVSVTGIATTTDKDTFDVLTTLKPSEVNLAYTGWHDASAKEWDGSDWQ